MELGSSGAGGVLDRDVRTEYPLARNVIVIVVTQENPVAAGGGTGARLRAERVQARVEVGDLRLDEVAGQPADEPLRGTRANFAVPCSDVRAPTTWSQPFELLHQLRDFVVRVRHVDVGPHDDPASAAWCRPCGPFRCPRFRDELDEADALDLVELLARAVVGAVVDHDDLERVWGSAERGAIRSISAWR